MKRIRAGIIVSIFISQLTGCSPNETQNPFVTEDDTPFSVVIGNTNKNMPSGGIITSEYSDAAKDVDVRKIVDGKPDTKYVTRHSDFYILWEGNQSYAVNRYSLLSAADTPENDPRNWTLEASNDGGSWVELDKQTKQTFSERGLEKVFELPNKTEYKYYRLNVEKNNGGKYTQIAEYTLQEVVDRDAPYTVSLDETNQNMPGRGELTSQYGDFPKGSDIGKLADNDLNTKFITNHSDFYIHWAGNTSAAVNYYTIVSAHDSPEGDPRSWSLYGSTDNEEWTLVDSRAEESFTNRKEEKRYQFENKADYKYYRLDIRENNGATFTHIAELTLKVVPTAAEELMKKASTINDVSKSPMGSVFYSMLPNTTTDEVRAWLLDPDNEPATMPNLEYFPFKVTLYPYGDPLPADVNQHAIGDCSGLSALASLAYSYPKFIKSIITDNGDETYTVKMFDPAGKRIEVGVTNKFLSGDGVGIAAATGKKNTPTWGTVLEKAILKWKAKYDPANQDLGGISSQYVMPLFTGNGYFFNFWQNLTSSELSKAVKVFLTDGYLITGGFSKGGVPMGNSTTVTGHAYTFLHSADPLALCAVRNPWGGNPNVDGSADGVLDIPDNGIFPPLIDILIMDPGIAPEIEDKRGTIYPYIPPTLTGKAAKMGISPQLYQEAISR